MTAREWGYDKLLEILEKHELDDTLRTEIECVVKVVEDWDIDNISGSNTDS
jgi:hypothetical protein